MKVSFILLQSAEKPEFILDWLNRRSRAIGVDIDEALAIRDNELKDVLSSLYSRDDAIVVVGAAGNKEAVKAIADILGVDAEINREALDMVRIYYMDTLTPPPNLDDLALTPEFSDIIPNNRGPIPGFVAWGDNERIIVGLPPSTDEAIDVFENGVEDYLRRRTGMLYSATFSIQVEGEVSKARKLARRVDDKLRWAFVRLDGRFASTGIPIVSTVFAANPEELSERLERVERELEEECRRNGLTIKGARDGEVEEIK